MKSQRSRVNKLTPLIQFLSLSLLLLFTGAFWGSWLSIGRSYGTIPLSEFIPFAKRINQNLGMPMRLISIPCIGFVGLSAWLDFRRSLTSFLLYTFSILLLVSALCITVFVEIPINNQFISWTLTAAPTNWNEIVNQWVFFNNIRTVASLIGFVLYVMAVLKLFPTNTYRVKQNIS